MHWFFLYGKTKHTANRWGAQTNRAIDSVHQQLKTQDFHFYIKTVQSNFTVIIFLSTKSK